MAKAVISNITDYKLSDISAKNYLTSKISNVKPFNSKVDSVMPFRVKFINIGVPNYSSVNVPPIGIAVIGFNNYIL